MTPPSPLPSTLWSCSDETIGYHQIGEKKGKYIEKDSIKRQSKLTFKRIRASEWLSHLRHCIAVGTRDPGCATRDPGSSPGSVTADRDRETHGAAHNWPSGVRVRKGMSLSHRALATPVAGQVYGVSVTRGIFLKCLFF